MLWRHAAQTAAVMNRVATRRPVDRHPVQRAANRSRDRAFVKYVTEQGREAKAATVLAATSLTSGRCSTCSISDVAVLSFCTY